MNEYLEKGDLRFNSNKLSVNTNKIYNIQL